MRAIKQVNGEQVLGRNTQTERLALGGGLAEIIDCRQGNADVVFQLDAGEGVDDLDIVKVLGNDGGEFCCRAMLPVNLSADKLGATDRGDYLDVKPRGADAEDCYHGRSGRFGGIRRIDIFGVASIMRRVRLARIIGVGRIVFKRIIRGYVGVGRDGVVCIPALLARGCIPQRATRRKKHEACRRRDPCKLSEIYREDPARPTALKYHRIIHMFYRCLAIHINLRMRSAGSLYSEPAPLGLASNRASARPRMPCSEQRLCRSEFFIIQLNSYKLIREKN